MEDLFKTISETAEKMLSEMKKNVNEGNKAAGQRARKLSIELSNHLKQYRKESVK